ncbi:MAG: PSD1 and planctomycete cytochrome C domain-containing protein [Acidobacteria bacterium]|nr:PSD1 and planctomycete cytochrome C domain-containing protein [Acidobacteriota bacterium]
MRRVGTLLRTRYAMVAMVAMVAAPGSVSVASAQSGEAVSFTDHIRPIFERSCWNCHGAASQLSGLDLRTRDTALDGGKRGPALVPGRGEESRLYRVLAGLDTPKMPMGGGAVTEAEIAAVRTWIDDGAHWDAGGATSAEEVVASLEHAELPFGARDYWAFRLPEKATVPASDTYQHPVDRFLEVARKDAGVAVAPRADAVTRLRRAYLDLIGLPPSPAQVDAFLADNSRGAWERVIDELLDSPHYGERWGRHWMDVARYADSTGFEQDYTRPNAWRYRDYVIAAFNKDKPYSQFIREQIAGDELDYVTDETLIATGFLRAGPRVQFREKDNPERRHDYLDDVLATVGRGVMGMTVQCARCHNHKFDPILQRDYYALQASIFGYVETDWPLLDRDEAEAYGVANAAIDVESDAVRAQIREIEAPHREALLIERIRRDFPDNVLQAAIKAAEDRTPGEALLADQVLTLGVPQQDLANALSKDEFERRLALQAELDALSAKRPPTPAMAEIVTDGDYRFAPDGPGDEIIGCPACRTSPDVAGTFLHEEGGPAYEPPPSYFLSRGDPLSPTEPTSPGFLTVAAYGDPPTVIARKDGRTSGRRLALAEWLTSRDNPLTARVMVNRIWHHHFGRGIVRTLDNLGQMGELPTHPELLDWLAVEFMDRGWSVKEMHRLMMTSEAYQMTSGYDDAASQAADPANASLWRFRQQRLEAEALRDAIMAVSGGIDLTVGGPPIFPFVPDEVLKTSEKGVWRNQEDGPDVWRRSVYVYRRRSLGFPFFDTFDLPDQNQTAAARNVTTVATQALTLMNNAFVLNQAALFADRLRAEAPDSTDEQVELAYRIALARSPTANEMQVAKALVAEQSLDDLAHVMLNLNEFLYLR